MDRLDYRQTITAAVALKIRAQGLRVFIAEQGDYGFFTDEEGTKVVSFQTDLGAVTSSGNYITDNPKQTGNGWRLSDNFDPGTALATFKHHTPPRWATMGAKWRYTTAQEYLDTYQASSKFKEVV